MSDFSPGMPLPDDLLDLLDFLTSELEEVGRGIRSQARTARITVGSSTMIDVEVSRLSERVAAPDGPLPPRAIVLDSSGAEVGELLVWVRDGRFIGLEQAWWTDDPPDHWPTIDRIRIES